MDKQQREEQDQPNSAAQKQRSYVDEHGIYVVDDLPEPDPKNEDTSGKVAYPVCRLAPVNFVSASHGHLPAGSSAIEIKTAGQRRAEKHALEEQAARENRLASEKVSEEQAKGRSTVSFYHEVVARESSAVRKHSRKKAAERLRVFQQGNDINGKHESLAPPTVPDQSDADQGDVIDADANKQDVPSDWYCELCRVSVPAHRRTMHCSSTTHIFNRQLTQKQVYGIGEWNRGYQLMQKMHWDPETGLGADGTGIKNPVATVLKHDRKCLSKTDTDRHHKRVTHFRSAFSAADVESIKQEQETHAQLVRRGKRLCPTKKDEFLTKAERRAKQARDKAYDKYLRRLLSDDD